MYGFKTAAVLKGKQVRPLVFYLSTFGSATATGLYPVQHQISAASWGSTSRVDFIIFKRSLENPRVSTAGMSTDQKRRRRYKAFLYFYQNGRCAYCLEEMRLSFAEERTGGNLATLDHVKPLVKKGKTSWENLVLCCSSCNHSKGSKCIKPVFPPLKLIRNRISKKKGGDGYTIYQGLGSQVFDTDFIKQTAERIYEAPNNHSITTPLLFPANMVESIVSQPVLLKRYY